MTDQKQDDEYLEHDDLGEDVIERLPDEGSTPFSTPIDPIDDASKDLDERTAVQPPNTTHPMLDSATDIDAQEAYDAGIATEEPNAGNTVIGYDPDKDQRRKQT